MKKLFISQPMNGKTDEEILKTREEAIKAASDILGEKIKVINTLLIDDAPKDLNAGLWYLGQSLLLLAQSDVVYFANGWRKAKGCVIENICATEYGLLTIESK